MTGYYKPFGPHIKRGQRYGANPGLGPNPAGGHNGDDYLTNVGEPVRAAGDGVVIHAGVFDATYEDNFGWNLHYGGVMAVLNLDGPTGPYVEYGHLSELHVKTGDRVRAGQVIAYTGNTDGGTGVSTGPHCHVGVLPPGFNLHTNTYGRVNPDLYLAEYWTDEQDDTMPTANEIASAVLSYDINQEGGTPGKINLGAMLAWYNANNRAIINGINGQITATGAELAIILRDTAPADLAKQIDAAGAAAAVRDELVNLLKGK